MVYVSECVEWERASCGLYAQRTNRCGGDGATCSLYMCRLVCLSVCVVACSSILVQYSISHNKRIAVNAVSLYDPNRLHSKFESGSQVLCSSVWCKCNNNTTLAGPCEPNELKSKNCADCAQCFVCFDFIRLSMAVLSFYITLHKADRNNKSVDFHLLLYCSCCCSFVRLTLCICRMLFNVFVFVMYRLSIVYLLCYALFELHLNTAIKVSHVPFRAEMKIIVIFGEVVHALDFEPRSDLSKWSM